MSNPRRPSAEETRLAQEEKEETEARFKKKRLQTLLLGLALLCAAAGLAAIEQPGIALLVVLASAIAFVECYDAHGCLQETRRRVAVTLFPDFSVLQSPSTMEEVDPTSARR